MPGGKTVGVLMGGLSAEREVSLITGRAISGALAELGHKVKDIDVGRDVCEALKSGAVDVAFIALHGGTGEDGSMQGLLEVLGIPYTGSGVLASALAMDKLASKAMFERAGLLVPPFEVLRAVETPGIEPPFVVKPVSEGSSIGVSIVRDAAGAHEAIEAALSYGPAALVEKYIDAKEINIGILGNRALGGVEVRPTLEFYSYEAKYTTGMTDYILPPEITDTEYEICREAALGAHRAIGASGATRVDLLLTAASEPYVLEVNTIPGMTEMSLLPKIAKLAGLGFVDLVGEILDEALSREAR